MWKRVEGNKPTHVAFSLQPNGYATPHLTAYLPGDIRTTSSKQNQTTEGFKITPKHSFHIFIVQTVQSATNWQKKRLLLSSFASLRNERSAVALSKRKKNGSSATARISYAKSRGIKCVWHISHVFFFSFSVRWTITTMWTKNVQQFCNILLHWKNEKEIFFSRKTSQFPNNFAHVFFFFFGMDKVWIFYYNMNV